MSTADVQVISVGGSIIAPDQPDVDFLKKFHQAIVSYLQEDENRKLIMVSGGGAPARQYQEAYRSVVDEASAEEQDWIGIAATRLNARLLKALFGEYCRNEVVIDPTAVESFHGRVLIAAGWKPGFSTDNDAVVLAERFGADTVINLSNIEKIYTADPKTDPEARPIDQISWADFRKMVGDQWSPGRNLPFDPVAARRGAEIGLRVISAAGRDIPNILAILEKKSFVGSVIGPQ
ncbi:MAG TPA: UMP kinase [Sediminispirochaeta sp.]|nr:UMP kinase [Sediminispirochaeta sp.]